MFSDVLSQFRLAGLAHSGTLLPLAVQVLSNLSELELNNNQQQRALAACMEAAGQAERARHLYERVWNSR